MLISILGISELKWTGMGEFNSDDHSIYYCRQESLWLLFDKFLTSVICTEILFFPHRKEKVTDNYHTNTKK